MMAVPHDGRCLTTTKSNSEREPPIPPGAKLGILVYAPPAAPGFRHAVELAAAARRRGVAVYFYCLDDAVTGLDDARIAALAAADVKLFACAYAAHRRGLPLTGPALYSGLGMVTDILTATDRVVGFN